MKVSRLPAIVFAVLALGPARAATPDVLATARAVDDHYNHLKSFRAEFTEVYQGPGVSRTESGTLWLKKPGRMRWEYHHPREKLFLTDSKTAYFYVPADHQVRKTAIKDLADVRSPLRFLLGKTKLEKELDLLSWAPDITPLEAGSVVLRGIPRNMKDRISEVLLEVTPGHQIHRIVIQGVDGTVTDFRFSKLEEDLPFADSLFQFIPPPGVEVITDNQAVQ